LATDITPFSQESGVFFVLEREGEMRKYLPVSAVFILAIMISIPAHAQSAKEAIMGLKKLQARCQSEYLIVIIAMLLPMQNSL